MTFKCGKKNKNAYISALKSKEKKITAQRKRRMTLSPLTTM